MASTVTPATLTVTLTEAITLNGAAANTSNVLSIASVGEISRRIYTVATGDYTTVGTMGSRSPRGGEWTRSDVKYLRITNLDNSNYVAIRLVNAAGAKMAVRLQAGQTFQLSPGYYLSNSTAAAPASWSEIDSIEASADTATVDIEVYVASA
jgi:hypothetical protein|tara:strand:- start:27120 stop:27575 length:456 start_codon:yes stop_codon:yes gene_type:complete